MLKKIKSHDYIFLTVLLCGLALHIICNFTPGIFADEGFYPTIALRLLNGDSLILDEWDLTQFSSMFIYIPVSLFVKLTGGTQGLIVYLRAVYIIIHTVAATGIYAFFRKYRLWAVAVATVFYTLIPYRFAALSYNTVFFLGMISLTLLLTKIYESDRNILYIAAGICYGCCCVCNPLFCLSVFFYIVCCIAFKIRRRKLNLKNDISEKFTGKRAVILFGSGLGITACASIIFFFSTGGSFDTLAESIRAMVSDSDFSIFKASPISKIEKTAVCIRQLCFNQPMLFTIPAIMLIADKNRKRKSNALFHLILAFICALALCISMSLIMFDRLELLAISLPLSIVSLTAYAVTENKNRQLFYCIWIPGLIASLFQYISSNTFLANVGWSLFVCNMAGVIFMRDLFCELSEKSRTQTDNRRKNTVFTLCRVLLCLTICIQIPLQCNIYQHDRLPSEEHKKLTSGPYDGIYAAEPFYSHYTLSVKDLDTIKSRTRSDDLLLISSCFSWMYLHSERPVASCSTWQSNYKSERLRNYYKIKPEKIPDYIYISFDTDEGRDVYDAQRRLSLVLDMFEGTYEELENGFFMKVSAYKG